MFLFFKSFDNKFLDSQHTTANSLCVKKIIFPLLELAILKLLKYVEVGSFFHIICICHCITKSHNQFLSQQINLHKQDENLKTKILWFTFCLFKLPGNKLKITQKWTLRMWSAKFFSLNSATDSLSGLGPVLSEMGITTIIKWSGNFLMAEYSPCEKTSCRIFKAVILYETTT